jgi:methionyl-tRNA synthetase
VDSASAERFYVTTPIYYVNGTPHIGHAYTTILADVLTRYHRLIGQPAYFLTGTDEHGLKVQEAAEAAGLEPKAFCDTMVVPFKDLWERLDIRYDRFIRTTDSDHVAYVQQVLQALWDAGEIYTAPYKGWYCVPDERFWTEKDLAEGKCPECGRDVIELEEENYFFRMGKYRQWLIDHIEANPEFIFPASRRNEVLGFLRQGLADLCISRPKSRLKWGIPMPFDEDYVTYVWFDALLNYVSAVVDLDGPDGPGSWWPASLHLIGKDIITTHCVYWPTMLHAAGLPLPGQIAAHGWWLVDETKMSKSLGNVIQPLDLADKYGVDAFRFFLMRDMTLGQDRSFSEVDLVNGYNADLANNLGNALSRVTKMLGRYREGVLGAVQEVLEPIDREMIDLATSAPERVRSAVDRLALTEAVEVAVGLVREINRYLEVREPWHLAKQEEGGPLLDTTLYIASETLRMAALLLMPVMPAKATQMLSQLGVEFEVSSADFEQQTRWGVLQPGDAVPGGESLFPRAELPEGLDA